MRAGNATDYKRKQTESLSFREGSRMTRSLSGCHCLACLNSCGSTNPFYRKTGIDRSVSNNVGGSKNSSCLCLILPLSSVPRSGAFGSVGIRSG